MFDSVQLGHSLYDAQQRSAWVPEPRKDEAWSKRLAHQHIILAETSTDIAGFMTLRADGYVDLAFIRSQYRGAGLFRRLYRQIEIKAKAFKLKRLTTHASLMARPAFAAMGFSVIEPETVEIKGVSFERFAMEKRL